VPRSRFWDVESPEGLRVLYLELLLGVTGLLEPKVPKEETLLTICAEVPPYQPPASLFDYVKTLFFHCRTLPGS
jgi:hypothetical protein